MARQTRTALERNFQRKLIKEIKEMLPGSFVAKVDFLQGIPDLLILYGKQWAMLEVKRSAKARRQPNQEYYVDILNRMSFCRFIYPENKKEVLDELCKAFRS